MNTLNTEGAASDRELLELAAKAAGHSLVWGEVHRVGDTDVDCTDMAYVVSSDRDEAPVYWNPLEDDGDALRLAVAVSRRMDNGLLIMPPDKFDPWAIVRDWGATLEGAKDASEDPCAATRRAIVRAAASLAGDPA